MNSSWPVVLTAILVMAGLLAEANLLRIFIGDWIRGRREERTQRLNRKDARVNRDQQQPDADTSKTPVLVAAICMMSIPLLSRSALGRSDDAASGTSGTSLHGLDFDTTLTLQPSTPPASPPPAEPERRAFPSPWSSPPYPSSEYLGPTIGVPNSTPDYALMNLLKDTAFGRWEREARLDIYGWVNTSYNLSTSKHSNLPNVYDLAPNRAGLNQAVLRFERNPDTVQTDHVDCGFRVTNLYGSDYRFTVAKGWFDKELLDHNRTYGYDMPELYGLIYVPNVAQGMVLKIGRFISPPDIEAQLAPDNYLFTHSTMFSIDPYTFTGVLAMFKVDNNWSWEAGIHAGNDMAPWSDSAAPNGHLMVRWVSDDNNDSIWAGLNSLGDGKYRNNHDNLQHLVATWSHRFNDKVNMATEIYYMWQFDALKGGSVIDGPVRSFGTGGGPGVLIPGLSDSLGIVNYFQIQLSDKDYLTIRNDFLADYKGQRTGFSNYYSSHTIGWSHNLSAWATIRPEIKYERAWTNPAYDNGVRHDQVKFGIDLTIRF
jgi:hypothetical protein